MKRLSIAAFLIVTSLTIFGLASKSTKKTECIRKNEVCCKQPRKAVPAKETRTDYIFWEPVNRLMMIHP